MACEIELFGDVATLSIVVDDPDVEGFIFEQREELARGLRADFRSAVEDQFGGQLTVARIEFRRGESIAILVVIAVVGRAVIEFGALMAGLRELSRLLPGRMGRGLRGPLQAPRVSRVEVILGPSVLMSMPPQKAPKPRDLAIALSAAGGAALIIIGVILGHFL